MLRWYEIDVPTLLGQRQARFGMEFAPRVASWGDVDSSAHNTEVVSNNSTVLTDVHIRKGFIR